MNNSDIYAAKAQKSRRDRVAGFSAFLQNMEGQSIDSALKAYSLQTGIAIRTLEEYWDVVSLDNKGPIYERHGIIRVRHSKLWRIPKE